MKWQGRKRSSNIDDRRGQSSSRGNSRRPSGNRGLGRIRMPSGGRTGAGGIGSIGLIIAIVVIGMALGVDPM